jgi:hypothetical protein
MAQACPCLPSGHGDAEPLIRVNEVVVVVDAQVDPDPLDLAREAGTGPRDKD